MSLAKQLFVDVDEDGRLILPAEAAARYGLAGGERIPLVEGAAELRLPRPSRLSKLTIEPTSRCNLDCRTCMRSAWEDPLGMMSDAVFDRIIDGLKVFSPPPSIAFGGFGEPLFHPRVVDMVRRAKDLGTRVELITNGTMLTPELSKSLAKTGVDVIWVSLDGATPDSYADIRLGAELSKIIENIACLREAIRAEGSIVGSACGALPIFRTELGIAFVAMKRNIADLPAVLDIGLRFDAKRFMVTNVLPYTQEASGQALYNCMPRTSGTSPQISLPRMQGTGIPEEMIARGTHAMNVTRAGCDEQTSHNHCPFIAGGAGAISWDGSFSPCLPLLHSHTSYLTDYQRYSRRYVVGNVVDKSLNKLWNDREHLAFRERVRSFDFAPCTSCGGCELSKSNEEDCAGNHFPTCGGCLWAQGLIQCP